MASINLTATNPRKTHEGATASPIKPLQELERSVMACLLWEDTFYEDGISIAERIKGLIPKCKYDDVSDIAYRARNVNHLRHVPLLIVREMARQGWHIANLLDAVIQRPDELTEFLAIYWQDGKQPLSAQVKKGLAKAFTKFNAYQLAKYNRPKDIKLRDVLFLCHAKPKDKEQETTWKQLVDGTLEAPDTWEVGLSSGADKKETWTRLIKEKKLGGLATLRNLRNFQDAGVDEELIRQAIAQANYERVLPFRFIAAARYAPQFEPYIEIPFFNNIKEKLDGKTVILIDHSGSMNASLSEKSDMTRFDAACGIGMIGREMFADVRVFAFSNEITEVPPRRGFALRDAIYNSMDWGGTYLGGAVAAINDLPHDRLIVISDEQSHDRVPSPRQKGYMLNVASYENGVGYGPWTHITGWSEAVFKYIYALEMSVDK